MKKIPSRESPSWSCSVRPRDSGKMFSKEGIELELVEIRAHPSQAMRALTKHKIIIARYVQIVQRVAFQLLQFCFRLRPFKTLLWFANILEFLSGFNLKYCSLSCHYSLFNVRWALGLVETSQVVKHIKPDLLFCLDFISNPT